MSEVDVAALRDRVRAMERTTAVREPLSRSAAIEHLLPGGLRAGGTYAVHGSHSLLATLLAGGSADGRWCGLVGLPDLGVESASGLGVDLTRTLVVPDPGESWAEVTATLVEALPLVAVRPASAPTRGDATRLAARLRARSSALVVLLDDGAEMVRWPGLEARLRVVAQEWSGITGGRGRLLGRELTVEVRPRTDPARRVRLVQRVDGTVHPAGPATPETSETPAPTRLVPRTTSRGHPADDTPGTSTAPEAEAVAS